MIRKLLEDKNQPGNKCFSCIEKIIPGGLLTCGLTGKRIRHYQKACENYRERNDIQ